MNSRCRSSALSDVVLRDIMLNTGSEHSNLSSFVDPLSGAVGASDAPPVLDSSTLPDVPAAAVAAAASAAALATAAVMTSARDSCSRAGSANDACRRSISASSRPAASRSPLWWSRHATA
jgi:hypothetical protein